MDLIVWPVDYKWYGQQGSKQESDDLTGKPGIDQVRNPAGVIDVGMGEKQKVDVCRRYRESVERHLRVMTLGNAAVHQDMNAAAVVRLKPDQVAGAGAAFAITVL